MKSLGLTVFFDGGCGLCGREIRHYRNLAPLVPIHWIDVSVADELSAPCGVDRLAAMAEFHVMDRSGQLYKGAEGFLVLWAALPHYHNLSKLCRLLRIEGAMRFFYGKFARWHFKRRCRDGFCGVQIPPQQVTKSD